MTFLVHDKIWMIIWKHFKNFDKNKIFSPRPILSLQSQFVTLPALSKCIEVYDQFLHQWKLFIHTKSVLGLYYFSPGKKEGGRDILFTSWFMLALSTITILTDQVVCMLLFKAKAVIWKYCKSEFEESAFKLRLANLKIQFKFQDPNMPSHLQGIHRVLLSYINSSLVSISTQQLSKRQSHLTMYNEFVGLNSMTTRYMFRLIKPSAFGFIVCWIPTVGNQMRKCKRWIHP
jgi:hypothetical protein